jgi:hypothetical protein
MTTHALGKTLLLRETVTADTRGRPSAPLNARKQP